MVSHQSQDKIKEEGEIRKEKNITQKVKNDQVRLLSGIDSCSYMPSLL
jgi:hypothetical protein